MQVRCMRCCRPVEDTKLLQHMKNYSCQTFGMEKPNKPTLNEWVLKHDWNSLPSKYRSVYNIATNFKPLFTLNEV